MLIIKVMWYDRLLDDMLIIKVMWCDRLLDEMLITLVNKVFVPWTKMPVSYVFLYAEFKYVFKISLSPIVFMFQYVTYYTV